MPSDGKRTNPSGDPGKGSYGMKKQKRIRAIARILLVVMIVATLPLHVVAVETDPIVDGSIATSAAGLRDYSMPSDSKHAYDPFAQLESEQATQEYRDSVQYVAGSIIYKVNQTKGWFGDYKDVASSDALSALGIDLSAAQELSRKRVEDGLFTDTYEVIYEAKLDGDVWDTVDALSETEGVVDAQPNYLYEETALGLPTSSKNPDMDKQWYLESLEASQSWIELYDQDITGGEGSIVAVIDTGVDYTHNDLAANMWVNVAELNGTDGVDDDGNGYVDDIYGCSTVGAKSYHSGDPMDDHGHGTHVAGIIAMTANNSEGGVGLAYGTKIMAIKAGQASGYFSDTDIAEAINYAATMGADVINMSFGGTGRSFLVEEALANAFASCVLVAAAGNNGWPTTDAPPPYEFNVTKGTFYPAGYSYVLGVMASDPNGGFAYFSNWDYYPNGGEGEYELVAPGVDIWSTLPGNNYAAWDGTSMAAPMVSAAAALIRSKYPDRSTYSSRFIMGQLASATEDTCAGYPALNLGDSLNKLPTPNLTVKNAYLFDDPSIDPANDGDGIVDAGETIDFGFVLRNQWGMAGDVTFSVNAVSPGGIANPNIEWITDTVTIEDVGTFSEQNNSFVYTEEGILTGVDNPIRFKVKDDCINDAHIVFNITVTCSNALDETDTGVYTKRGSISFYVQRGRTLSGTLDADLTMTPDDYWIIENALYIPEGVTLTVEPGTQIQFWGSDAADPYAASTMAYIAVDGTFLVNGTEEAPVEMFPSAAFSNYGVDIRGGVSPDFAAHPDSVTSGTSRLSYANILNPRLNFNEGDHLYIVQDDQRILYRELSGSTVSLDIFTGGIVQCNNLSDSALINVNFSHNNTRNKDFVAGNFERVLFQGCYASVMENPYHSSFNWSASDCVFTGEYSWTGEEYYKSPKGLSLINPQLQIQMPDCEISEVFTYGESKYVLVEWSEDPFLNCIYSQNMDGTEYNHYYPARYYMVNALAAARGGHLAVVNTEAELEALWQQAEEWVLYNVGYYRPDGWINGEESYVALATGSDRFGCIHNGSLSATSSLYPSVFYEFPATVPDAQITAAFTQSEYVAAALAGQEHLPFPVEKFTNNAMLNSFYQTDVTRWNRLMTDEDRTYVMLARNNYWGTDDPKLVQAQIVDADTYAGLADIVTDPYLTLESPELETIYPFVTEAYLTDADGDRISAASRGQQVQLHVKFNRDMDTSVLPMVSYGPASPYTDYVVNGSFVSAREWVGSITLNGFIDAGMEFIRIKDAVAADDAWLKTGTDEARFAFEIQNTGAEALALQAVGGENKVELTWMQDDYDTLAGFNVYRSDAADGTFTKLNTYLIPGTIREYVDTDVEPGEEYFYYFTVMGTDLVESNPSNISAATPIDNVKPSLTHTIVTSANYGQAISFSATATDNIGIEYVRVYYRATGAQEWKVLNLSNTEGDSYYGVIAASEVSANGMEYYMEASDGTGAERYGSPIYPLQIAVDNSLAIYTASPYKVDVADVAEGVVATVAGANFTDTMTLTVGGIATEYTFVSATQISFTLPEGNIGSADILLKDGTRSARLTHAFTYTDANAQIQIVAPGEAKSGEQIRLPLLLSADGSIDSVYAELNLTSSYYSNVAFQTAEGNENVIYSCNASGGTVKIAVAAMDALDLTKPIGYLVLDVNRVTKTETTGIELVSAQINAVDVPSRIGCKLEVKPNFTVSGKITYYNSNEGIAGVTVRLSNGMTAVTDENGVYTFTGITTNSVIVTPEFVGAVNGAISAQDASLVLQAVTGEGSALSDLQFLAADVDGDGSLTANDASSILKKSVGSITGEFEGSGREWTFDQIAKSLTLTENATNVDFQGILLGDVSGNWTSTPVESLE